MRGFALLVSLMYTGCGARTGLSVGADAGSCDWGVGTPIALAHGRADPLHAIAAAVRADADIALVYWRDSSGREGGEVEVTVTEPPRIVREGAHSPVAADALAGAVGGWHELHIEGDRAVVRRVGGAAILDAEPPSNGWNETPGSADLAFPRPEGVHLVSVLAEGLVERAQLSGGLAHVQGVRVGDRDWIAFGARSGVLFATRVDGSGEERSVDLDIGFADLGIASRGGGEVLLAIESRGDRLLALLDATTLGFRELTVPSSVRLNAHRSSMFAAEYDWLLSAGDADEARPQLVIVRGDLPRLFTLPAFVSSAPQLVGRPASNVAGLVWSDGSDNSLWFAPFICEEHHG